MTFSVLILTRNEAANISECIASLPWRGDVHVLDSDSVDATQRLAEALGAKVHNRRFTTFADQRNYGLALPFAHDWVISLDADERMTPDLATEIERMAEGAGAEVVMARVRRKDMFLGRWLRHASGYPTWFPRVFRRNRVRVMRDVNERYDAEGSVVDLAGHIIHFPFNKGLDWWFERHNGYSSIEAKLLDEERGRSPALVNVWSSDHAKRRAALKQIAYRLPARPWLMFLYLYVLRGGFLDGAAGYHYASMRLAYEIMIDAKVAAARYQELARRANSARDAAVER